MGVLSIMGNSFGCSASGERLVSAAKDGDLQEAKLEYNLRLARYSTFGVRNSTLHYSAARGHHEIVSLLLESGVDINLQNVRGQTALMLACQYGHWEVVQTLMLFNANIHRTDYLNGGTALHFAALNGHTRCIRLLLADYVPSISDFWNMMRMKPTQKVSVADFDVGSLCQIVNRKADGGITALHMAALNGHTESVQLLLDLGAFVSEVTVGDGMTIELIGAGSMPLHYAACGGNAACCQVLIARGASLTAENANRNLIFEGLPVLSTTENVDGEIKNSSNIPKLLGLPVLSTTENVDGEIKTSSNIPKLLEFFSDLVCRPIFPTTDSRSAPTRAKENQKILIRSFGILHQSPLCIDPCVVCLERKCVVCLERKCTVAAEGCNHESCTRCALYLCSTYSTSTIVAGSPGSIPCPLCRHAIVSFFKLSGTSPVRGLPRTSLSLSLCTTCPSVGSDSTTLMTTQLCKPDFHCTRIPPLGSSSFRSFSCQRFPSMKLNSTLCMGAPETSPCLVSCSRAGSLWRSASQGESSRRSWLFANNQIVTTGSS